ncbi:hypothetical protein [Aeromonas sobria]|uniref:hypothetical protein n=1 Tax=Aeromonas sobria TaxID=646 RepID=UPI0012FEAC78|nr:hypothetical protein [Aeromonas sobria]
MSTSSSSPGSMKSSELAVISSDSITSDIESGFISILEGNPVSWKLTQVSNFHEIDKNNNNNGIKYFNSSELDTSSKDDVLSGFKVLYLDKEHSSSFSKKSRNVVANVNEEVDLIFSLLSTCDFSEGVFSPADIELRSFYKSLPERNREAQLCQLLNDLAIKCYAESNNYVSLHFLNVIKNSAYIIHYRHLYIYGVVAVSKPDLLIKEAAISLFEGWMYDEGQYIKMAVSLLEEMDLPSDVKWLDRYRKSVIKDLRELMDSSNGIFN